MKVKLADIYNVKDCLTKISAVDMPIKDAYLISKLVKKLNLEYESIEEFRVNLVKKYGEEQGNNISVSPGTDNFTNFMKEYSDFINTEIELGFDKININIARSTLSIKPIELFALEKFVNFEGVEDTPQTQSSDETVDDAAE